MPFFIRPFSRKPFKLFAIDADTGQPIDPNVRRRTRVTYYELQNGSNGSKKLVAHKSAPAPPAENGDTKKDGDEKKGEEKPESAARKDAKKDGEAAKPDQKGGNVPFTAEEDERLKALKAEMGKSWKMISEDMGRFQHVLKARWKEIDPDKQDNQAKKDDGGKTDDAGGGKGKGNQGGDGQGQGQDRKSVV